MNEFPTSTAPASVFAPVPGEGHGTIAPSHPARMRPVVWLGGPSPGGLALPPARPTADQLYAPRGVWLDGERLVVCDSGNHRILIWHGRPTRDHAPADVVLGQPGFTAEGPRADGRGPGNGLHLPTGVIVHEERLMVADAWHHRILVWERVPRESDTPPDWCLGQATLEDVAVNRGGSAAADGFSWPYGLAVVAGRLYVADTGHRRVLVWRGVPDRDRPADIVLGQPDMASSDENRGGPASASSFRWPHAIAGDESMLWVADAGNHRVLGWRGVPDADRPADVVLGQEDDASTWELPYGRQGPSRLRFPYGMSRGDNAQGDQMLAVADTANNRVLLWPEPIESRCFAPARAVIGQSDFAANGENHWKAVTADSLCWPYGVCLHEGRLAIADSGNNRVMMWEV